jgi:DNA replication factor GINS
LEDPNYRMGTIEGMIKELFDQRERDFLLSPVRVTMSAQLDNIEVGDFRIGSLSDGQNVEMPRWVAEELAELKLCVVEEEAFEGEILRALTREKMLGSPQLSALQSDFYLRMRRRLRMVRQGVESGRYRREDFERLKSSSYDLIGRRLSKLLSLSGSSSGLEAISDKLTQEEKAFFVSAQSLSKEWKDALLGEGAS